jgi:ureidoacrylate peracid hydrolase
LPNVALLLIDLQKEWFDRSGGLVDYAPTNATQLLAAVTELVTAARAASAPIIWVRLAFRPGHFDAVRDSISRTRGTLLDGTRGAELVDGIGRTATDVVVIKRRPSAFYATDLEIVLRGLGIQRLVVGGMATNWAVESTVRDGHTRDFQMVVVREATGSSDPELHESSLRSMAAVYARVMTLDEVVSRRRLWTASARAKWP